MKNLGTLPWATLIVVIIAIVGGIAVITHDLTFEFYVKNVGLAAAVLGIGRGLAARKVD